MQTNVDYDVVILGGSLAGSAAAVLLRAGDPSLSVLVVEKAEQFGRRVGEATVEVSAYFLSKVLHLTQHLNERHLSKQGMRFWFHNASAAGLEDCSEIGGRYLARMPAWQVDRSTLDEEVLRRATVAGADVLRPAKVMRVRLRDGGPQTVVVEEEKGEDRLTREITARWVVDASGFTAMLSRQEGWYRRNEAHPTTAVWCRWEGVKDLDGAELCSRHPDWASACHGIRSTATNHFMGDGWWAWCIPLKGGDYSIGVVFDQRLVDFPAGPSIADRLKQFLSAHPVARELMEKAVAAPGDSHWRANLPYFSTRYAGNGYVLVGDAAAFLDPLYSPGMDWLSYTVTAAVDLILGERMGSDVDVAAAHFSARFTRAYERWFQAVYQDKYDYFGDFELMSLAFRLDLGMYYVGIVSQPIKFGPASLLDPPFNRPSAMIPFRLMRCYNRRLSVMARERRRRGTLGRENAGRRFLLNGYLPERETVWPLLVAYLGWLKLELREGWRSWFSHYPERSPGKAEKSRGAAPAVS